MVSVINRMPDDAEIKDLSYPEIRSTLEARDMLFGVRHSLGFPQSPGVIVALAGAMIEHGGKIVRVTEIAANTRARDDATHELMDTIVAHARQQGADELVLDMTPQQGTAAADFVERFRFSPSEHGDYVLRLADVGLDELRG